MPSAEQIGRSRRITDYFSIHFHALCVRVRYGYRSKIYYATISYAWAA